MLQRCLAQAVRKPPMRLRVSASAIRAPPRRPLSSSSGGGGSATEKVIGGRKVRAKTNMTEEELFQASQKRQFGHLFIFKAIEKIPIKNAQLRHLVAAFIFMGLIMSPKLVSSATKAGTGYLDMEAPEEVTAHREKQGRGEA